MKYINNLKAIILSSSVLLLFGCFHGIETQNLDLKSIKNITEIYPVVVLGSGVAGLTAANYLAQANIPTIVIEGETPGGALMLSHSVRNWPGVIDLPGREIIDTLRQQAEKSGVRIIDGKATKVDFTTWPFTIELETMTRSIPNTLQALSCIIATGATPNYLGIPGETGDNGYWGRGVTNCAVCDGPLYRGLSVGIVGGGDAAMAEASYLSGIAEKVTIFVRGDSLRAKDHKKRDEVLTLPNVSVIFNTKVTEVQGDDNVVTQVKTLNTKTNETSIVALDGLFLAIGSQPNTTLFKKQLTLDDLGHVVLTHDQATSRKGVFAAGDVCDPVFRQAVTSAGQGCKAALQTQKFLDDLGFKPSHS